jgi:membrane-bound serine protease (ClpP class)
VPVVTFVHPSGARAASAGTYILYASHVAAMTPGTNLGAATPVAVGGGFPTPGQDDKKDEKKEDGEDAEAEKAKPKSPSEAKAVNDAVAYIRSLAEMRDRNADWAERAVREAESLSSSAALRENVIDVVATNTDDLLKQIHGRTVRVGQADVVLDTEGVTTQELEPDWRTRVLSVITNPNVALILMMIGIYGLIFEFMNPGALVPGTIGGICLLIGLYALALLPVNYAGIALMVLGIGLMIAEAFSPSFGILGIGGVVAFVLGATILVDTEAPGFQLSWAVIAGMAVASLAFTLLAGKLAVSSFRRRIVSGAEELIGASGEVQQWAGGKGFVFAHGERWQAVSDAPLHEGERVRVTGRDGLTLTVTPVSGDKG